jgi:hypothetical protein
MKKSDYKKGDVVVITDLGNIPEDSRRYVGRIVTVRENNGFIPNTWNLYLIECLGVNYENVRPITKLEKIIK